MSLRTLPELQPIEHLTETVAVRITAAERRRLEGIAAEIGAPVGRLVRAVLRRALAETESKSPAAQAQKDAPRSGGPERGDLAAARSGGAPHAKSRLAPAYWASES
jgi:hypothetical protein